MRQDDPNSLFIFMDPEVVKWRREQAHVDADIEGLARLPESDALVAQMDREGLSSAERRERLIAYYKEKSRAAVAAE